MPRRRGDMPGSLDPREWRGYDAACHQRRIGPTTTGLRRANWNGERGMDAYPGKLRLWESGGSAVYQHAPAGLVGGPHDPAGFAERLYVSEALGPVSGCLAEDSATEPYTLQWFLNIESHRHGRRGRWIPRLLEFGKHAGETLLGLGKGLGTDWLQYARHDARVVVCCPVADQLELMRRNFQLRGLDGRFLHAQPTALPLESASIDVACVNGLLHEATDPLALVREVYRVLKPGGKVLAVTPARYDVDYWFLTCFPWLRLVFPEKSARPAATRFSGRHLRGLFSAFVEHRVYKRQLRRSEVPHVWRWLPTPLLERGMGRLLILKAFKPLSAAIALQAAA